MNKTLRIGLTEFLNSLRSKAFIIGALAVPVFSAIALLAVQFSIKQKDVTEKRFAVVDETGKLFSAIQRAADTRKTKPQFIPEEAEAGDDQEATLLALSDRVRDKEIFAFAIIGDDVFEPGALLSTVDYYSGTPTNKDLPNWLRDTIESEILNSRFGDAGLDRAHVDELLDPPYFRDMELVERSEDGSVELGRESGLRYFIIPVVMMFLLFVMVMTAAPALLTTALEEKTNKVSEFLISAVSPFQLLMGKLLGALGTSMVLAMLYLTAAAGFAAHYGVLDQIPISLFFWFLFFLALSVLIYGSACIAIGSVCSDIRDAQSLMMPITLMIMIPVLFWQPVLQAPTGSFARAITLFPPATPIMLVLRNAIPPGLPWWELALGVVICLAFTVFTIWAAAKIYKIGILSQGQTPSAAKLIRWVFSK